MERGVGMRSRGETAVHLHFFVGRKAPWAFRASLRSGYPVGHVLDPSPDVLRGIADRVGAKRTRIERRGTVAQHIDLCGGPLRLLLQEIGEDLETYRRPREC